MNQFDKQINDNFIKCQTKQSFKSGVCLFQGCVFKTKLTYNLKRHMKCCVFSPGSVQYLKRINEVTEISNVTPVNIFENEYINMNIKNSWGCAYENKIVNNLHALFNIIKTKDKNIVNLALKEIISQNRLECSLKLIDNRITIYHDNKWINSDDIEFVTTRDKLKNLWYKKIRQVLQSNSMLWADRIPLMQKVAADIGLGQVYTLEHCHRIIDEVLLDQFKIDRCTITE